MDMLDEFKQYLLKNVPRLTEAEATYICSMSSTKKLKKKECILTEGEFCRHKIFIQQGLLRTYKIADDGSEYILKFVTEMHWTTDPDSFLNNVPSKLNIEAMEPTNIVVWNKEDFEHLRTAIPALNTFSEHIIAINIGETQDRLLMNISGTPEEKYRHFLETFPDVFARVPLHMIASYLGLSRETLTRVRQNLALASKN